jgi:hypothetical protein
VEGEGGGDVDDARWSKFVNPNPSSSKPGGGGEDWMTYGLPFRYPPSITVTPFQQLLSVLSPLSANLLPSVYRSLIVAGEKEEGSSSSPLLQYYPLSFVVDSDDKLYSWQSIVCLPFIDFDLLIREMSKVEGKNKERLSEEERKRDALGVDKIYFGWGVGDEMKKVIDKKTDSENYYYSSSAVNYFDRCTSNDFRSITENSPAEYTIVKGVYQPNVQPKTLFPHSYLYTNPPSVFKLTKHILHKQLPYVSSQKRKKSKSEELGYPSRDHVQFPRCFLQSVWSLVKYSKIRPVLSSDSFSYKPCYSYVPSSSAASSTTTAATDSSSSVNKTTAITVDIPGEVEVSSSPPVFLFDGPSLSLSSQVMINASRYSSSQIIKSYQYSVGDASSPPSSPFVSSLAQNSPSFPPSIFSDNIDYSTPPPSPTHGVF